MPEDLSALNPTIHRRRLRSELRKARDTAGRTQRDVAKAMDWSLSKLIRIETGDVKISTNDLRVLLAYYGIDDERVERLLEVARAAREPAPFSIYRDVAQPEYLALLGYESSAAIIRTYEATFIPGLLQTEGYAQAVISGLGNGAGTDALVELRMERQGIFHRDSTVQFHFVIDEAVIRRRIGGREVMHRQLGHLLEVCSWPNVKVNIIPFEVGLYPHLRISYTLFEFENPEDEDALFIETQLDNMLIRENSPDNRDGLTPTKFFEFFGEIEQIAEPGNAPALLADAIARLSLAALESESPS